MSQPDTPEQPDTESQKTAVPQPEMQPETSSETPSEPQEPAQWQPEIERRWQQWVDADVLLPAERSA